MSVAHLARGVVVCLLAASLARGARRHRGGVDRRRARARRWERPVTARRLALAAAFILAASRAAAQVPPVDRVTSLDEEEGAAADEPDIVLDVPRAKIGKLALDVENLQARLDIDTRVANLVRIDAGVIATVQRLKMQLDGVETQVHLVVRLQRVANVLERALAVIDAKPELAQQGSAPSAAVAGTPAAAVPPAIPIPVAPVAASK